MGVAQTQGLDPMGTPRLSRLWPELAGTVLGWVTKVLPLGEIGAGRLVRAHSGCSPLIEGSSRWRLYNSHNARVEITSGLRPARK